MGSLLAAFAGAASGLAAYVAVEWSKTSKGSNPWTFDAFRNALRIAPHAMSAIEMLSGSVDSMFRSAQVNMVTPGSAKNSYHQDGLAIDVKPGAPWASVEEAFRYAVSQVKLGRLGQVRTVIWEPSWVHFDWFKPDELPRATNYFKREGPTTAPTYTKLEL